MGRGMSAEPTVVCARVGEGPTTHQKVRSAPWKPAARQRPRVIFPPTARNHVTNARVRWRNRNGAPRPIRTGDLQIRSLLLYPAELGAHGTAVEDGHDTPGAAWRAISPGRPDKSAPTAPRYADAGKAVQDEPNAPPGGGHGDAVCGARMWWGKGGSDRAVRSHAPADSLDGRGDRAHVRLRRG